MTPVETAFDMLKVIDQRAGPLTNRIISLYGIERIDVEQAMALMLAVMHKAAPNENDFEREAMLTIEAAENTIDIHIANVVRAALTIGYCQAHDDIQREVVRA